MAIRIAHAYLPIFANITNPMWSIIAQRVDWPVFGVFLIQSSVGLVTGHVVSDQMFWRRICKFT
jgi:hypothetical protein